MNCHFLTPQEKKKLVEQLTEQFGITELPYLLLETGKEKVRAFSGALTKEELLDLANDINIEIIGLYIARREYDLRLSFDATNLFAPTLTKNVVEIDEEQLAEWIRGHDLALQAPRGTVIIKHKTDFFGCGKSTGERIANHVPKERRLRK